MSDDQDKKDIVLGFAEVTCIPFLFCENCPASYLRAEKIPPEEALRYAQDIGWRFKDNKNFCPECTVEERKTEKILYRLLL